VFRPLGLFGAIGLNLTFAGPANMSGDVRATMDGFPTDGFQSIFLPFNGPQANFIVQFPAARRGHTYVFQFENTGDETIQIVESTHVLQVCEAGKQGLNCEWIIPMINVDHNTTSMSIAPEHPDQTFCHDNWCYFYWNTDCFAGVSTSGNQIPDVYFMGDNTPTATYFDVKWTQKTEKTFYVPENSEFNYEGLVVMGVNYKNTNNFTIDFTCSTGPTPDGLSTGQIIGIVVGCIIVAGLIVFGIYYYRKRFLYERVG